MIPIYRYDSHFGVDKALLLKEALELKGYGSDSPEGLIGKFMMDEHTPRLQEFYNNFIEEFSYADLGETKTSYFYIDKDKDIYWHTDEPISHRMGPNVRGVKCSFNFLLSGIENEVEFEGVGTFQYEQALLNTNHRHRIKPKSDRVIARVAFKDYTYEEIVRKMRGET